MADKKEGAGPRFGLLAGMLDLDEELAKLFKQWLAAFEKTQSATGDEEALAALASLGSSRASQRHRPRGYMGWW